MSSMVDHHEILELEATKVSSKPQKFESSSRNKIQLL